jgi:hypothetical protein
LVRFEIGQLSVCSIGALVPAGPLGIRTTPQSNFQVVSEAKRCQ